MIERPAVGSTSKPGRPSTDWLRVGAPLAGAAGAAAAAEVAAAAPELAAAADISPPADAVAPATGPAEVATEEADFEPPDEQPVVTTMSARASAPTVRADLGASSADMDP